jgi:hypothetical protein
MIIIILYIYILILVIFNDHTLPIWAAKTRYETKEIVGVGACARATKPNSCHIPLPYRDSSLPKIVHPDIARSVLKDYAVLGVGNSVVLQTILGIQALVSGVEYEDVRYKFMANPNRPCVLCYNSLWSKTNSIINIKHYGNQFGYVWAYADKNRTEATNEHSWLDFSLGSHSKHKDTVWRWHGACLFMKAFGESRLSAHGKNESTSCVMYTKKQQDIEIISDIKIKAEAEHTNTIHVPDNIHERLKNIYQQFKNNSHQSKHFVIIGGWQWNLLYTEWGETQYDYRIDNEIIPAIEHLSKICYAPLCHIIILAELPTGAFPLCQLNECLLDRDEFGNVVPFEQGACGAVCLKRHYTIFNQRLRTALIKHFTNINNTSTIVSLWHIDLSPVVGGISKNSDKNRIDRIHWSLKANNAFVRSLTESMNIIGNL